jgi:hypothetical protein
VNEDRNAGIRWGLVAGRGLAFLVPLGLSLIGVPWPLSLIAGGVALVFYYYSR